MVSRSLILILFPFTSDQTNKHPSYFDFDYTMGSVGEERTFPLKRPRGHKVPVPRWSLKFQDSVTHVYTLYVGVQCRSGDAAIQSNIEDIIESKLTGNTDTKAPAIDTFRVTDGFDLKVASSIPWRLLNADVNVCDCRDRESGSRTGLLVEASRRH